MAFSMKSCVSRMFGFGLLLAGCATALGLTADQVILKNGDHFTGHVVSTGADVVALETEAAGTIQIRRELIDRVIPGAEAVIRPAIPVAATPPAGVSVHCMVNMKPVPATWAFTLQGAPNKVVLGTQSQEQFGAGLDVSLCEGSPRDTTNLAAKGNHMRTYKEKSTSIETDVAGAELVQQHFFHSPQGAAVYGVGDVFTNNSLGMAMQKSAGMGLLSPQYKYKALYYDFSADVRYLNQHLDHHSPELNLAAVRVKEQMHYSGKMFTWNEQGWVMPALNDVHALQAYVSAGPSVELKPWLHLGLVEEESYLGNAPHPNRKNYFSSAFSLTLLGGSGSRTK